MAASEKMTVFAKLTAQPGGRAALAEAIDAMFDQVETEDGCEIYSLHEDLADADVLWFFELYTDGEALAEHGRSEAMGRAMTEWGGLLAAAPDIVLAAPARAKGLTI